MKKITVAFGVVLSIGVRAQTAFYGGDWDEFSNLTAQNHALNGIISSVVYDDFTLTNQTNITVFLRTSWMSLETKPRISFSGK